MQELVVGLEISVLGDRFFAESSKRAEPFFKRDRKHGIVKKGKQTFYELGGLRVLGLSIGCVLIFVFVLEKKIILF